MKNLTIAKWKIYWPVLLLALILLIAFTFMKVYSATNEDQNGNTPEQIALEWMKAEMTWDGDKRRQLLSESEFEKHKSSVHLYGEPTDPEAKLGKYKQTEWKIDDENYIYYFQYVELNNEKLDEEWVYITKTDKGWKVGKYVLLSVKAKSMIKDIQPTVIKEM